MSSSEGSDFAGLIQSATRNGQHLRRTRVRVYRFFLRKIRRSEEL